MGAEVPPQEQAMQTPTMPPDMTGAQEGIPGIPMADGNEPPMDQTLPQEMGL
jgi:hypothetical protein